MKEQSTISYGRLPPLLNHIYFIEIKENYLGSNLWLTTGGNIIISLIVFHNYD